MSTFRNIHDDLKLAELVWAAEQRLPQWFRESSDAWTPDLASFLTFWSKTCFECWGLFADGETKLLAVVMLEMLPEGGAVNIHIAVVESPAENTLERFFMELKEYKKQEGVIGMNGWIMRQNRPLMQIAKRAGFHKTGLKMYYGVSHGRFIQWNHVWAGS